MGSRFSLTIIPIAVSFLFSIAWEQEGLAKAHYASALRLRVFQEKVEAPDFTLPDLNGRKVRLKDLRGSGVFVNFWATWCPPCRREMPSMEKLYNLYKDRGLVMLAVDIRERPERVKDFFQRFNLTFTPLLDQDGSVASLYGVRGIPTTYLIDRGGRFVAAAVGSRDWASREAREYIKELLARQ